MTFKGNISKQIELPLFPKANMISLHFLNLCLIYVCRSTDLSSYTHWVYSIPSSIQSTDHVSTCPLSFNSQH